MFCINVEFSIYEEQTEVSDKSELARISRDQRFIKTNENLDFCKDLHFAQQTNNTLHRIDGLLLHFNIFGVVSADALLLTFALSSFNALFKQISC